MAGIAPEFAAVLPLVIDVAVAVATTALVAVGDKPARRTRNAPSGATAPAPRSATPSRVTARSHRMVSAPSDAVSATALAAATASSATAQLAAELVAAKVTGQPVETVEAILVAHEDGDPLNRIAATLGVHHSAVKRILEAARHPPSPPPACGGLRGAEGSQGQRDCMRSLAPRLLAAPLRGNLAVWTATSRWSSATG